MTIKTCKSGCVTQGWIIYPEIPRQLRDKAQREGSELLILLAFPRNNSKRRETLLKGDVISGGQVNNRPGGRSRFRRRGVIASLLALST